MVFLAIPSEKCHWQIGQLGCSPSIKMVWTQASQLHAWCENEGFGQKLKRSLGQISVRKQKFCAAMLVALLPENKVVKTRIPPTSLTNNHQNPPFQFNRTHFFARRREVPFFKQNETWANDKRNIIISGLFHIAVFYASMLRVENQKPNESNATVPLTTKYSIRYGARAVEWERMQKHKIK